MESLKYFFIVSLFINQVYARTLTWDQSVQLAQDKSIELQAALATYEAAQYDERFSYSGFLPKINATLSDTQTKNAEFSSGQNYGATLIFSQNLFAGFADYSRVALAKANLKVAEANLIAAKASLSASLKKTYESLLYAEKFKKLTEVIIRQRRENYNNVELQFQSGRENKGSALLSKSYVEQAEYDDLSAANDIEVAAENLKRYLGLPEDETVVLTDSMPVAIPQSPPPDFKNLALQTPEVLTAKANQAATESTTGINLANFLPSLDLTGSYGKTDEKFFPNKDLRWSVGLTLTIPLFNGLKDYGSYRASDARFKSAKLSNKDIFEKAFTNLKQVYFNFIESVQKDKVDTSFAKAAEVRAIIARSRYKNGLLSFDDWDIIETDLIQRQKNALTSHRDKIFNEAQWEQAQGKGVIK